ncbi:MAG: anthranilate phosphoribosyltransferase [Omnitrophica WOR_2 bacterium RIFCSPLOWO2_12_FULL_51_8]|nr:MAG: anthranilate phosphoribosyltransferase [Omnitrophica WOR_2 bacterium RIFCSPLOWO2_12_FULL_51_8]
MIEEAIEMLTGGKGLNAVQMSGVMEEIMRGRVDTARLAVFLAKLDEKGETAEELSAAVKVMRRFAAQIHSPYEVILDTCGTGGDQKHTFNISTAAAFVASGAGIPVAKHGNRSVSSSCGSADCLEALGVNINMSIQQTEKCLNELGITFLFAQNFHPAMKYAMPARKAIGRKTIFNVLGPLSNPAGATHQLIGVYDSRWAEIIAQTLAGLGIRHGLIVHGKDGLDELTTGDDTLVFEVSQGKIQRQEINHWDDFGFKKSAPEDLSGKDAAANARILLDILGGQGGHQRDIVLLNAAAAIYAADAVKTKSLKDGIKEGIILAGESIASGKALEKLELLKIHSHAKN